MVKPYLYTAVYLLDSERLNISAAEDPIEISLSGINQVQIQPQIGFGFAEALRAFLRQGSGCHHARRNTR